MVGCRVKPAASALLKNNEFLKKVMTRQGKNGILIYICLKGGSMP